MTKEEYESFVGALLSAELYPLHDFEKAAHFEGCLPIEEIASRGIDTLRFGPMKPVGLEDPRTGRRPFAVVQLRQEDEAGTAYNMVGFQTRMAWPEQQRVFRMIPGLEEAEFLRYGSIHRNSYINAPASLGPGLVTKDGAPVFFAGQLTGVEGYTESIGTGLLAGINLARVLAGDAPVVPPATTMLGGLYRYLADADPAHFQPMNANFGLLDPIDGARKADRKLALVDRARRDLADWLVSTSFRPEGGIGLSRGDPSLRSG